MTRRWGSLTELQNEWHWTSARVIDAVLGSASALDVDAIATLQPEHVAPNLRPAWEIVREFERDGQYITHDTIYEELKRRGAKYPFETDLYNASQQTAPAYALTRRLADDADACKAMAARIGMFADAGQVVEAVLRGDEPYLIRQQAGAAMDAHLSGMAAGSRMAGVVGDSIARLEEYARNPATIRGIATGFPELDAIYGGLDRNASVLFVAASGTGKSTFMRRWACTAARDGYSVYYAVLEQEAVVNALTIVPAVTGLSYRKMRDGQLTVQERALYEQKLRELAQLPLEIIDDCFSLPVITERVLGLHERGEAGILFIDTLDALQPPDASGNRGEYSLINQASYEIQRMAQTLLHMPVVASRQVNKLRQRDNPSPNHYRPMRGDIPQSGWNQARLVLAAHRPIMWGEKYPEGTKLPDWQRNKYGYDVPEWLFEVQVLKNSLGVGGGRYTAQLHFNANGPAISGIAQEYMQ